MLGSLFVLWSKVDYFRTGKDLIQIVSASEDNEIYNTDGDIKFTVTWNISVVGTAQTDTEMNKVLFTEFSAKRKELMYLVKHDVIVGYNRPWSCSQK